MSARKLRLKGYFTRKEAAKALGLTVPTFRTYVREKLILPDIREGKGGRYWGFWPQTVEHYKNKLQPKQIGRPAKQKDVQ